MYHVFQKGANWPRLQYGAVPVLAVAYLCRLNNPGLDGPDVFESKPELGRAALNWLRHRPATAAPVDFRRLRPAGHR
jgi:hypothetical protein